MNLSRLSETRCVMNEATTQQKGSTVSNHVSLRWNYGRRQTWKYLQVLRLVLKASSTDRWHINHHPHWIAWSYLQMPPATHEDRKMKKNRSAKNVWSNPQASKHRFGDALFEWSVHILYMLADFTDRTRRGQTHLLTFPMKLPAQSSAAVERRTGRSTAKWLSAKSRDHEIVRSQRKVSRGGPPTPPKASSVITGPPANAVSMAIYSCRVSHMIN